MYWIDTDIRTARMEAHNDEILVTAENLENLEKLAQPMKYDWQITVTTLSHDKANENFNRKMKVDYLTASSMLD